MLSSSHFCFTCLAVVGVEIPIVVMCFFLVLNISSFSSLMRVAFHVAAFYDAFMAAWTLSRAESMQSFNQRKGQELVCFNTQHINLCLWKWGQIKCW